MWDMSDNIILAYQPGQLGKLDGLVFSLCYGVFEETMGERRHLTTHSNVLFHFVLYTFLSYVSIICSASNF